METFSVPLSSSHWCVLGDAMRYKGEKESYSKEISARFDLQIVCVTYWQEVIKMCLELDNITVYQ